jgi:phenylacetaldehyde dehydrogenase
VQRQVFDDVVAGIAEYARTIKIGPGIDPATQMGPLVSQDHLHTVLGFVYGARSDGVRVLADGNRNGADGYFMEPTILTGTTPGMPVRAEEIGGPVLVAEPFDTAEEAVRLANDTPYGLAAGVFTRDMSQAVRTASAIRAGLVWINTWNTLDAAVPFGGYKQSGWGRELGCDALDGYLETKSLIMGLA